MADQLESWADGQAKAQVLEFVRSVTEPGRFTNSTTGIPPTERSRPQGCSEAADGLYRGPSRPRREGHWPADDRFVPL